MSKFPSSYDTKACTRLLLTPAIYTEFMARSFDFLFNHRHTHHHNHLLQQFPAWQIFRIHSCRILFRLSWTFVKINKVVKVYPIILSLFPLLIFKFYHRKFSLSLKIIEAAHTFWTAPSKTHTNFTWLEC